MATFFYDTDEKLREIFKDHCSLSAEQYTEIEDRFMYLICDIQEDEQQEVIEDTVSEMHVIFDFLYNTKSLTIGEYNGLCNMADEIQEESEKLAEGAEG